MVIFLKLMIIYSNILRSPIYFDKGHILKVVRLYLADNEGWMLSDESSGFIFL